MKSILALVLLAGVSLARAEVQIASLSTVLSDLAENVGGDKVRVTSIVKPGMDPHDFDPAPGDLKAISRAQIVLASGLGFEAYLGKLRKAAGDGPVFVVVGESLKPIMVEEEHDHDHGHDHAHGEHGPVPDPHWWHSIANMKIAAKVVRDALIAADPQNKNIFTANTRTYLASLDALAKWARLAVAKLPASRRILVTSHDALGYFARDYGFEIHPVQGISTADQPSSKKIRDLIGDIQAHGVKAIFAENIENPKVLAEITKETGAALGGTLYADGLGDTAETKTYEGMMRHNVQTIVNALQ